MTALRDLERDSIRHFVESCSEHFTGRVLDLGCGEQPYRYIVEAAGGEYLPFDRVEFGGNVSGEDVGELTLGYDAILCTQVVQYVEDVYTLLAHARSRLSWNKGDHGHLVLTYPTNWPEVEAADLHRFTRAGMERLLAEAGFEIIEHEGRAQVTFPGWSDVFVLGYGVVARA